MDLSQTDAARAATPSEADVRLRLGQMWTKGGSHGVLLLDPQGVIQGWKGAAHLIFGYREAEVLGRHMAFIFTDDDVARGIPQLELSIAAANGHAEDDRWHRRRDGIDIWISGAVSPIRDGEVLVGFVKVVRDRTDLRGQIETLQKRSTALERQVKDRDAFTARLVHEVRNALSPMRTSLSVLQRDESRRDFAVSVMNRQIAALDLLVKDLTEAVLVNADKIQLVKTRYDLGADLHELAESVRTKAQARGQTLWVLTPPTEVLVCADRARIAQVVVNLLDNAIKYTPEGGKVWLKLTVEAEAAVMRVLDNGRGIGADLLPAIFDMFTQESPGSREGGFGVGLALVKDFVTAHRGDVEVRSPGRDQGSEFTVRLPLNREDHGGVNELA